MLGTKEGKKLTKYVSDYVVFDIETTGFSSEYDQITELSGVKVIGGKVVDEFTSLVNPQRPIPWQVSNVTGITDDMVCEQPCIDCVLENFLEFVGDLTLVGHNINTFDMKFIYRDSLKCWGQIPDNDYIDTLRIAKIVLPDLKHRKLVDLAEYYGISSAGAHRALNDCRMNQAVYEMMGREMTGSDAVKTVQKKSIVPPAEEIPEIDCFRQRSQSGRTAAEKQALIDELFGTCRLGGKDESEKKSKAVVCPKCGNLLQKRNGRFGEFMGCTGYPNCRYTKNL